MSNHTNNFPKLHNAMWPGLVGKGSPGAEPCIDLDTMLNLTAAAEVDGIKFDGVDIFLYEPHINIDISDDDLKRIAGKVQAKGLVVGSVVAPIWGGTGGGAAMGSAEERQRFVGQVRKGCRIAARLRELGARPHGVVRIDSASSVDAWAKDPEANTKLIAQTFAEACNVAESFGERLAAEGEICWGGMHSWKQMVKLLETVGRPQTLGFQADMAHTLLYTLGYNAPEDRILPGDFAWDQTDQFQAALKTLTAALRPWTIDLHIAQNDATVKGAGTHDKTGHHCLPNDPNGKLNIVRDAGWWLRDERGNLTKAIRHVCWDGCMFPNEVMFKPQTWNDILAVMIAVRDAHGWSEGAPPTAQPLAEPAKPARKRAKKAAPFAVQLPLTGLPTYELAPAEAPKLEAAPAPPEPPKPEPPKLKVVAPPTEAPAKPAPPPPPPVPVKPVEKPAAKPAPKPAAKPAPKPAKKAVVAPPKRPLAKPAKKPPPKAAKKPLKKAVKRAAKKAPKKPAKKSLKPSRKAARRHKR
jgi:sugar phosphate isomerase/epimerase